MTSEEIKQQTSMRDVLAMYGIKVNRSGMCSCPWHSDKKPSMKVFKDGYNCFSCGKNGDVFSFVQEMENCSFKQAFIRLGGTYAEQTKRQKVLSSMMRATDKKKHEKTTEEEFYKMMVYSWKKIEDAINNEEPLSERWCLAQNLLTLVEQIWECKYINNEEVNEIDGIRLYRKVRCEFDSK